jgi:membrane associated rhomboid family serine protease
MGIYDRDYVRREGPSFLGSFVERGRVCKWLVGINIVVFLVQVLTGPRGSVPDLHFTQTFDLNVNRVLHGEIWRLFTHAFLHDPNTIWHILWNMLFLWWFGSDMEDLYGPREFLTFYLGGCLASGLLFFFSSLAWMPSATALGASGGVMAVVTLCAIHYPRRPVYLFFFLPLPLWMFVAIYLARDAFAFVNRIESATAVAGHLGGALFAGAYYRLNIRLYDWLPPVCNGQFWRHRFQSLRRRLFGPRLRLYVDDDSAKEKWNAPKRQPSPAAVESSYHPDERTQPTVSAPAADEHLEAKMDAILEKISRVGKENLTESERAFLLRASEIFRRRRT